MKVKKEINFFTKEMKSDLDILNYGGHDYLLSASALPLEEQLFQPHFSILGKNYRGDPDGAGGRDVDLVNLSYDCGFYDIHHFYTFDLMSF